MIRAGLGLALLGLMQTTSFAAGSQGDPRFFASLKRLDLETRLDQICDYEAMLRIGRDPRGFNPDRAKAEVLAKPRRTKNAVNTSGGAFRSNGKWYSLSYACEATPDHMKVTAFSYQIGHLIPASDWPKYGLWR